MPIGSGGLISGIALAAKELKPGAQVIGVQSHAYPSMVRALGGDAEPCPDALTIAEGIPVKTAGQPTKAIVRSHVDIWLVAKPRSSARWRCCSTSRRPWPRAPTPPGSRRSSNMRFAGRRVATILTSGNIGLRAVTSVAMRELVRSGQLMRLDVPIFDLPGALSAVAGVIGEQGANIVDVAHDRLSLALNPRGAALGMVVEVQDRAHGQTVLDALHARRFDACAKAL